MPKAIVIGGGFGGIAAALRVRAKGYDVTLIDKQDKLGGRAYQYNRNGFIHDAGPTVVTASFLFDELFKLFGKRRQDYFQLVDLYPWYRIQFADGSTFDYGGTLEQMEQQIANFEPADIPGFHGFLEHSKRIFDVGFTKLGAVPFHNPMTMVKAIPDLLRLKNHLTVWQLASKYFRNDKLRRVFSFQPLLVGGNPFNTTSIYSLIFYLERQWGVQFAMGGTGAIVRGLQRLMEEEGVEIRLGEEVERIDFGSRQWPENVLYGSRIVARSRNNGPAVDGVVVKGGTHLRSDAVICNADAPHAYTHLIDPQHRHGITARRLNRKSKITNLKFSMGLFVLYFGTRRQYPNVAHHTIVLGQSYRKLITRLFDKLELETEDLSVYLHRPTATDASMAPAGCDSFYVLVPVPNLQSGHDWSKIGQQVRDATVRYLERTVLPGLSECICEDFWVAPDHFEKNLNTLHGSGFSIQPIFSQSAYFRFHNKAPGIEGLYFVGAATHPGAGMPGVLCSAKVLDHLIPAVAPSG